jgi:hypothetical protein
MFLFLTHLQVILRYKENGGRIEPYYSNHDTLCIKKIEQKTLRFYSSNQIPNNKPLNPD